MMRLLRITALFCTLAGALPAQGAEPPDFSGAWVAAQGFMSNQGPVQGFSNTPSVEQMAMEALQPWAKLLAAETNTAVEDSAAVCDFAGPFRHTNTSPFVWMQTQKAAYFIPANLPVVGVIKIYMTDSHPAPLTPRWEGHSIGRWEGDTLVVDTVGWNDRSWLGSNNQPHSEELHLVRRIRLVGDGSLMEMQITVSDRRALKHPYTYNRYFKRTDRSFQEASDESLCNGDEGQPELWWRQRQSAIEWEKTHPPSYETGSKP
ncbi:MAG: hypothetical protein QM718_11350 [Steroidobacteraceae bacterium]